MIPRIVLDLIRSAGAIRPAQLEERIRKIAGVVNGGLDASSLSASARFSVAAAGGAVPYAFREGASHVLLPIVPPQGDYVQNTSLGTYPGAILPVAGSLVAWGAIAGVRDPRHMTAPEDAPWPAISGSAYLSSYTGPAGALTAGWSQELTRVAGATAPNAQRLESCEQYLASPFALPAGSLLALSADRYAARTWFVAVGDSGAATSPDGLVWTARGIPAGAWLRVIHAGPAGYVAIGLSGGSTPICATSPDSITWTSRTIPYAANQRYTALAWNGSVYVAVGYNVAGGVPACATSPDGITWTQRTVGGTDNLMDVTWGNSLFVAVGYSASNYARVWTSPDGITWTVRESGSTFLSLNAVKWNGSVFVASAWTSAPADDTWIMRSSSGTSWSAAPASYPHGPRLEWNGIVFHGGESYSFDGTTWAKGLVLPTGYDAISCWGGRLWLAFSKALGWTWLSGDPWGSDGSWTGRNTLPVAGCNDVCADLDVVRVDADFSVGWALLSVPHSA